MSKWGWNRENQNKRLDSVKKRKLRENWLLIHRIERNWEKDKEDSLVFEVEEGRHCCRAYFAEKSSKGENWFNNRYNVWRVE